MVIEFTVVNQGTCFKRLTPLNNPKRANEESFTIMLQVSGILVGSGHPHDCI